MCSGWRYKVLEYVVDVGLIVGLCGAMSMVVIGIAGIARCLL